MAPPPQLSASRPAFQRALHAWYRAHRRRLPWRERTSLYGTVVSEFMLQQTQVATVLPYFDRWLRAFPDFPALATATEDRVLKLWEGLGYYSRARNLHRLAQALIRLPTTPRTPAEWQELPGIGPYTAAAITSIAFGEPKACVDGNVVRILARLTGEGRTFRDGSEAARHFTALAAHLVAGSAPGEHNQAMMELGATVCLRQNPLCHVCPVAAFCVARASGDPTRFPRLAPKLIEPRTVLRLWCLDRHRLLLHRATAGARRLAGLHELPDAAQLGLRPAPQTLLATKRRAITRFRITEHIHLLRPTAALRRRIAREPTLVWVPLDKLDAVSLSGPHRRWTGELLRSPRSAPRDRGPLR